MKHLIICSLLTGLLCVSQGVIGQSERKARLDSALHDPFLFPTVSVSVLPKGFMEVSSFSNLLYGTRKFNDESALVDNNIKTSIFNELIQLNYGITKNGRFNVGIDLSHFSYRLDTDTESSPFKVLGNSPSFASDRYLSHIGIRARYLPLEKNRNFMVQHAFETPLNTSKGLQNRLGTQLIYIHKLGVKWYLFNQVDLRYSFKNEYTKASFTVPYSAIVSYLVRPNFQLYGIANFTGLVTKTEDTSLPVFLVQGGLGFQYQVTTRFGFNTFWNKYLYGKNIDQFSGLNLGLRVVI